MGPAVVAAPAVGAVVIGEQALIATGIIGTGIVSQFLVDQYRRQTHTQMEFPAGALQGDAAKLNTLGADVTKLMMPGGIHQYVGDQLLSLFRSTPLPEEAVTAPAAPPAAAPPASASVSTPAAPAKPLAFTNWDSASGNKSSAASSRSFPAARQMYVGRSASVLPNTDGTVMPRADISISLPSTPASPAVKPVDPAAAQTALREGQADAVLSVAHAAVPAEAASAASEIPAIQEMYIPNISMPGASPQSMQSALPGNMKLMPTTPAETKPAALGTLASPADPAAPKAALMEANADAVMLPATVATPIEENPAGMAGPTARADRPRRQLSIDHSLAEPEPAEATNTSTATAPRWQDLYVKQLLHFREVDASAQTAVAAASNTSASDTSTGTANGQDISTGTDAAARPAASAGTSTTARANVGRIAATGAIGLGIAASPLAIKSPSNTPDMPFDERNRAMRNAHFGIDQYTLSDKAKEELDHDAAIIKERLADNPNARFEVVGHASTTGSNEHNLALSEKRADAVIEYMKTKHGLQSDTFVKKAVGEEKASLIEQTADGVENANNRAVVISQVSDPAPSGGGSAPGTPNPPHTAPPSGGGAVWAATP